MHSHDDIANTLVLGGMGKERFNLIVDKKSFVHRKRKDANVRALRTFTPREYLRLQGIFKVTRIPKFIQNNRTKNPDVETGCKLSSNSRGDCGGKKHEKSTKRTQTRNQI